MKLIGGWKTITGAILSAASVGVAVLNGDANMNDAANAVTGIIAQNVGGDLTPMPYIKAGVAALGTFLSIFGIGAKINKLSK